MKKVIDLHQHVGYSTQHLARAVKIMDATGIGIAVNLSGGTVTRGKDGEPSEFERNKQMADMLSPGRFLHYMNLDYANWDEPDFARGAAEQIEEGYRLGAAGLKEYKRLGLYLKNRSGDLIRVDDAKLDPVWQKCGELKMPVSIHVADPKAFWMPYDDANERWEELKDHKNWWFGDTNRFPEWKELLEALNRVIARHPKTTFVCVHFANNPEELEWVDASLSRYPNMMADLAARIPELGRHNPRQVRNLFLKHQDRILFATDFMVYDRLILGSSGNEPPPTDAEAEVFYSKEWRWLETEDRDWKHMTPIQGNWNISSINLPVSALRKIYFTNARKLLARSLPKPVLSARRISRDLPLQELADSMLWDTTSPGELDQRSQNGEVLPELATTVRALWSENYLYLKFECPFTRLTTFEPPLLPGERFSMSTAGQSLWDRDVVEAFIGNDMSHPERYKEFQVAPTNEKLDLSLELPNRDFEWTSGFESSVEIRRKPNVWVCQVRIPLASIGNVKPAAGTRWPMNLFRCDQAHKAFLAWRPTLSGSFHVPERSGALHFAE